MEQKNDYIINNATSFCLVTNVHEDVLAYSQTRKKRFFLGLYGCRYKSELARMQIK